MKFGVLQFFSWPQRRTTLQTVYQRAMQRIEIMDKSGYDAVWLAEHQFARFGRMGRRSGTYGDARAACRVC